MVLISHLQALSESVLSTGKDIVLRATSRTPTMFDEFRPAFRSAFAKKSTGCYLQSHFPNVIPRGTSGRPLLVAFGRKYGSGSTTKKGDCELVAHLVDPHGGRYLRSFI
jgi:hypothetical protein